MKLLNVPNTVTILRIVLIPFFIAFLIYRRYDLALTCFILAGLSDALDGHLARRMGLQSALGRLLDPLADKLLIITSFVIFTSMKMVPVWFTITIFSRDVFIVMGWFLLYLLHQSTTVRPTIAGKAACAMQMILIGYTLLAKTETVPMDIQTLLIWLTAALTVISGIQYIYRGLNYRHA